MRQCFQCELCVGRPWNRPPRDAALMTSQAVHRPIAAFINDILHRPVLGIVCSCNQSIPLESQLPPLVVGRFSGSTAQGFLPAFPNLVERLLVKRRWNVGFVEQKIQTDRGIGRVLSTCGLWQDREQAKGEDQSEVHVLGASTNWCNGL